MSPNDLNAPHGHVAQVTQDLGPLAWVIDELRKSMDAAVKATRRFVRESEAVRDSDLAALDGTPLRMAKQQLHQASGALEMVGMPQAALLLRAMESAVQHYVQHPQDCTDAAAQTLEKASFALLEYLETVLAGQALSAVALFPQYRDVQALSGAEGKVHPADLWPVERRLREPQLASEVAPLAYGPEPRKVLDAAVLNMVKGQDVAGASGRMRDVCLGFAQAQTSVPLRTFWKVAAGYFDAMAHGLLPQDNYTKRVASRVLMVSVALAKGDPVAPERLLQDMLFFCAQAYQSEQPGKADAVVLQAVGQAFGLERHIWVDYERPRFGRFDPAVLAQARKRIAAATEVWSALAGGDAQKIKPAVDQFSLVGESLNKLHPGCQPLSQALMQVMHSVAAQGRPPSPEVGMEVATAVLYLQAAFAALDSSDDTMAQQAQTLAQRLQGVLQGQPAQPLEPWMEALYRQVSDQQTMGSVVGELRITLGETERLLDQYFRNPADTTVLAPVSAQLSQMRGVLSVLGLDQAVQAMVRMRHNVERLQAGDVPAAQQPALFDTMGNSLGALGFLIDMLSYQRNMARKLYEFDEATGELKLLMGRVRTRATDPDGASAQALAQARVQQIEQPVVLPQPASEALVPQAQAATDAVPTNVVSDAEVSAPATGQQPLPVSEPEPVVGAVASEEEVLPSAPIQVQESAALAAPERAPESEWPATAVEQAVPPLQARDLPPVPTPVAAPVPAAPVPLQMLQEDTDEELLGIFLDEAREVVGQGKEALQALESNGANLSEQTVLRRAFHTLKGSSRMVGLDEFGHAGWAMEQMLNAWLAEQKAMPSEMQQLALHALDGFEAWAQAVQDGTSGAWQSAPFRASADAMRLEGQYLPLDMQAVRGSQVAAPVGTLQPAQVEAADALQLSDAVEDMLSVLPGSADDVAALASLEGVDWNAAAESLPTADTLPAESLALDAVPPDALQGTEVSMDEFNALLQAQSEPVLADDDLPSFSDTAEAAADAPDQATPAPLQGWDALPVLSEVVPQHESTFGAALAEAAMELPEPSTPSDAAQATALAAHEGTEQAVDPMVAAAAAQAAPESVPATKQIGTVSVSVPLFNVYLNEAEDWSQQLLDAMALWQADVSAPQPESAMAWAHALAGSSATVGFHDLSSLARKLEHALEHVLPQPAGDAAQVQVFVQAAEEIRRLLHQFAAGFLGVPSADVLQALQSILQTPLQPMDNPVGDVPAQPEPVAPVEFVTLGDHDPDTLIDQAMVKAMAAEGELDDDIDVFDVIDPDLFPIFEEEALELLPALGASLRNWAAQPADAHARNDLLRTLHTLKGSARLAGAMRLGEMAHRMESALEALGQEGLSADHIDPLFARLDSIEASFGLLRAVGAQAQDTALAPADSVFADSVQELDGAQQWPTPSVAADAEVTLPLDAPSEVEPAAEAVPALPALAAVTPSSPVQIAGPTRQLSQHTVRVRSHLLDRLINEAGEVMIARSRLDGRLGGIKHSLADLSNNLERLRQQLRDIEVQAESQMQSRMQLSKDAGTDFDPLEFDRFTRVQELTRMMAESVNDVATVQRNLLRDVTGAEDDLVAQGRQARDLQRDLLRTRMVEFDSISERLYAVVRRTSKETGKQVKLGLAGGTIEMDRGVLERMVPAFEHLLRNCVDHGIESPQERAAAGKSATGTINVQVVQEGNDVAVVFSDDGSGLDVQRIQAKALEQGLVQANEVVDAQRAAQLVFMPGFSTATQLTEVSGRGIGMDVVRAEVLALGGRIETQTQPGQGTSFRLVLPLTTAVTQVVMLRAGSFTVGVPASLVEVVRRISLPDLEQAYRSGQLVDVAHGAMPFFWSGAVWSQSPRSQEAGMGKTRPVVVFRSASQRIALHVDEVLGHQEVVVKNLGPQMARLPGLTGMSVLPSGAVVLIYNPVALATVYGERIAAMGQGLPALLDEQTAKQLQRETATATAVEGGAAAPLVMVVDDSITVRRVSQRLLQREGYRVVAAADGLQALEKLQDEVPCVVLSDIEMPRMDGFDLLRHIRAQAHLQQLPIIMITSRIAQKHRDHAMELGANHYLGKPYSDEELMALVHHYAVGKPLPVVPAQAE